MNELYAQNAHEVVLTTPNGALGGMLVIPQHARGIVLFAHGSGSSRYSPRNQAVAAALQRSGFATLLFDLLTVEEELKERDTAVLRFDIDLLSKRLILATDWLRSRAETAELAIGYFGASTGAAAALVAASGRPHEVRAVVSRGGRPDLAEREALEKVRAPTLLIVGGADLPVIDLNWEAYNLLTACPKKFAVVQGATHLFEERGALEQVAALAREWFEEYLSVSPPAKRHGIYTDADSAHRWIH